MDFYEQLTNYIVFPTESDHHGSSSVGSARVLTEVMYSNMIDMAAGRGNYIVSGFTLPPISSSITDAPVAAGSAIIDGHLIMGSDNILVDLSPSLTNYLYLKLEYSGDYVNRPLIEVNTTGTTPAHCAFLGKCVTDGTQVTSVSPWRTGPRIVYGSAELSGSTVTKISAGGRSWNITGSGGWTLTFDTGSFINKPIVHIVSINSPYPYAPIVFDVNDGASNDEITFTAYGWDTDHFDSLTQITIAFIACG